MKTKRMLSVIGIAALGAAATASAQISTTGPFPGSVQEGFEAVPGYSCPPCFLPCLNDVFGTGVATMCDANPGGTGMHITGGWGFQCSIGPYAGSRLFGSAGGPAMITFANPVKKFGAYMGDNGLQGSGTADFYDAGGALLGSQPLSLNGCVWVWNGWESTNTDIKQVKISGVLYGGHILLDDMVAEGGSSCYPDCNNDGALTVQDFGCFQTAFVGGNMYADCNGDGVLTVQDFGCFQTAFVAGCP